MLEHGFFIFSALPKNHQDNEGAWTRNGNNFTFRSNDPLGDNCTAFLFGRILTFGARNFVDGSISLLNAPICSSVLSIYAWQKVAGEPGLEIAALRGFTLYIKSKLPVRFEKLTTAYSGLLTSAFAFVAFRNVTVI